MTSGFSTIAGSVLTAYINLGVPAQNLITSSVMSIPASIAISKMRIPETQEPVTRGRVIVDRGDEGKSKPVSVELAVVLCQQMSNWCSQGKRPSCFQ
jgi:CNT family concentrative nucleoside transporter